MTFMRLVFEELQGMLRGRFTLLAIFLLLGFICVIGATVGTSPNPYQFYWPVFAMGPLILLPVAAWHVASARTSRFLEAVFTTPVSQSSYIVAQLVAMVLVGFAYLACALPFLAVEVYHIGPSTTMARYLLMGAGSVLYCAGLGVLIGTMFTARGSIAPIGAAIFAMVASAAGLIFLDAVIQLDEGGSRTLLLRALHLTVGVVLGDALGIGSSFAAVSRMSALVAYTFMVLTVCAAAWWVFSRRQSPEGWHLRRGQTLQVVIILGCLLLTPAAIASTEYEPAPLPPPVPQTSHAGVWIQIVERGAPPQSDRLHYERDRIADRAPNHVDLLLFIYEYPDKPEPYTDIEVRLWGEGILVDPPSVNLPASDRLPRAWPHSTMGMDFLYLRVPVSLETTGRTYLADNVRVLGANITFQDANGVLQSVMSTVIVYSDIPHASLQMAVGGSVFPLIALSAHVRRRFRLRA